MLLKAARFERSLQRGASCASGDRASDWRLCRARQSAPHTAKIHVAATADKGVDAYESVAMLF